MAHQDRLAVELANDAIVVIDDRLELETLERRRIFADRFDLSFQARPGRSEDVVAGFQKTIDPSLPASRGQPQSVNQHDRGLGATASVATHDRLLWRLIRIRDWTLDSQFWTVLTNLVRNMCVIFFYTGVRRGVTLFLHSIL